MKILNPRAGAQDPILARVETPVSAGVIISAVHECRKLRERRGGTRVFRSLLMSPVAAAELMRGAKKKYVSNEPENREDHLYLRTTPTQMVPGIQLSIEVSYNMPTDVVSFD